MSDLQAAAERLRRLYAPISNEKLSDIYEATEFKTALELSFEDERAVVTASLAEHDPAPLTADAMTAAGWVRHDGGYWRHSSLGERIYFVEWSGGWNLKIESGANIRTLGELRRLMGLLGGEG